MPFKSQAQRRKFAELLVEGKISPQTYEEWNRETGKTKLPERVTQKTKRTSTKRKAAKKRECRSAVQDGIAASESFGAATHLVGPESA